MILKITDEEKILKLETENENLKERLTDLLFELNYNKQTELIEFLRNLYESTFDKNIKKIPKNKMILNLRNSIEEFAKTNKIKIK